MRYPSVYSIIPGIPDEAYDFDAKEVRSLPISTWICSEHALHDDDSNSQANPIIIILCLSVSVKDALERYYSNSKRRKRINDSPAWIYFDLAYTLAKWDDVWRVATTNIFKRDAQAQGDIPSPPPLELSKQLHRDTADAIGLKEGLRLHLASLATFRAAILPAISMKNQNRTSCTM
jgi:hypothetical protein